MEQLINLILSFILLTSSCGQMCADDVTSKFSCHLYLDQKWVVWPCHSQRRSDESQYHLDGNEVASFLS